MNEDDDSKYLASNFLKKKNNDSQYESEHFEKKEHSPGWLERNANFAEENINKPIESLGRGVRDLAGGAIQGLANIVPGLYNLGASGINALGAKIPKSPMIDLVPHTPSATAGDLLSFLAAPGFLKATSKIPELMNTINHAKKIPIIAEGIKHASNILEKYPTGSRLAGNAILGGAYSPDNPALGLGLGAVTGGAYGLIGKGYSGIKNSLKNNENLQNILSNFNPSAHAKELENYLSGGANNITNNSRHLANDIRNAHKMREQESGAYFDYALNKAGHEPLYKTYPFILNKLDESEKTLNMIKDLGVGDLFNVFKNKPTLQNAHALQSELGYMEREIQNRAIKTGTEKLELSKIKAARNSLKDDINRFFERRDISNNQPIGHLYKKGSELYQEHVTPYLSNNKLLEIVRNGSTDIKNLHSVFDTPTNKITKEGIEKIGSINKIMQDLPENAKQRIIFDAIGGNKLTPESLLKKLEEIKSSGFESYFTPEVEESMNALNKKLKNSKNFKIGSGIAVALTGAKTAKNALNKIL